MLLATIDDEGFAAGSRRSYARVNLWYHTAFNNARLDERMGLFRRERLSGDAITRTHAGHVGQEHQPARLKRLRYSTGGTIRIDVKELRARPLSFPFESNRGDHGGAPVVEEPTYRCRLDTRNLAYEPELRVQYSGSQQTAVRARETDRPSS